MRLRNATARHSIKAALVLMLLGVAGCASYHPLPLTSKPDLITSLDQVVESVPPGSVDVTNGVSMTETAVIAASMNPALRATRMKRNVAQAEAFSAGLLPDPKLSLAYDNPTNDRGGLNNGFFAGLSVDTQALLTRPVEIVAAENKMRGVDKDILWTEWQVIQQARTLYVRKYFGAKKLALLKEMTKLDRQHQQKSEKALADADNTLSRASADLTALMEAESQLRSQQRANLQTDNELDALMGLSSDIAVPQEALHAPDMPTDAAVAQALDTVADRRPDLLALQSAYKSHEAGLYAAVLRQFPSISIGFNTARDTTNIHTLGLGISMSLPIFNGSRGEIAVQDATRDQLHAEYQARIDQTQADIGTLWRQTRMIRHQMKELDAQLPKMAAMASKAQDRYKDGDFPAVTYMTLQGGLLAKKMEYIDLQQSLWTNRIGLDTLLAWPVLPPHSG